MLYKKIAVFFASALVLLAIGVLVFTKTIAPGLISSKVPAAVSQACKSCKLSFDSARVGIFPPSVTLNQVTFSGGERKSSLVKTRVDSLEIRFALWPLLSNNAVIRSVLAERPRVDLIEAENDTPPEPKKPKSKEPPKWRFAVEKTHVHEGSFTYVHESRGVPSSIECRGITIDVGPWGTTENYAGQTARGHATGILEESGRFDLQVTAVLWAPADHVTVDLRIYDQILSQMDSFFHPSEGLRLEGKLIAGRAQMEVTGETHVQSSVTAQYDGLRVTAEPNRERSAFAASVMNFAIKGIIPKDNFNRKLEDKTKYRALTRKPNEAIVGFLVRGMKEAAIDVAKY